MTDYFTDVVVVVPRSEKNINSSRVAVNERWSDMCMVFSDRCDAEIKDSVLSDLN